MIWILYSLLVAVFVAFRSVVSKKSLQNLDQYVVAWFIQIIPGILIAFTFLFTEIPYLKNMFFPVLVLDCFLSAVAAVWSTKALFSEVSVAIPMVAFTPLFLLATGYLMLGEVPSKAGFVGVILIVVGSYILNYKEKKNGLLKPFRALVKNDGSKLMLGAAFIWSITANLDKIAIKNSSPVFFAMAESLLIALFIYPFARKGLRKQRRAIWEEKYHLSLMGVLSALILVFQMLAVSQTLVVYVNSIKRLSIPITIILGGIIFKEKEIGQKFAGGVIMVVGVLLLTLL